MLSGMQASRSKARGMNAMLAKLTKIAAVIFMILAAALVLIQRFFLNEIKNALPIRGRFFMRATISQEGCAKEEVICNIMKK